MKLPDTSEETNKRLAELSGSIASLKFSLDEHHRRRIEGSEVDWTWYHRAKAKLGFLIQEEKALHKHVKDLRHLERRVEQERLVTIKASGLKAQADAERRAQFLKQERLKDRQRLHAIRMSAGRQAALSFVSQRFPEAYDELLSVIQAEETKASLASPGQLTQQP